MDDNTPLHGTTSQGQDPNFTAELCQFLTSLAKTSSEDDYSNLSLNMTRLREALLTEVVETEAETPSSPRRTSDHDSSGMSVSTTSSSPCPSSSRSRVMDLDSSHCSSSSAQQSHSDSSTSTSSPGSDQGNSSRVSITMDLSRRYYEGTIAIRLLFLCF